MCVPVRFPFALSAALALGMLYPTTQLAQVSKHRGKLAPALTPAAAMNYQVAETTGALGTLTIRRKFTNVTGVSITRLRFRIADITTKPALAGAVDLRALTSTGGPVPITGGSVQVRGLTLEQASIPQTLGGGLNSSLSVGVITVAQPLAPNDPSTSSFASASSKAVRSASSSTSKHYRKTVGSRRLVAMRLRY